MTFRYTAAVLAALTLTSLFGCGGGGGGAPPAHLRGRIVFLNTGQPLASATVSAGGASVVTDATGVFDFPSIPSTATTLGVTASGTKALSQTLPTLQGLPTINDLGDVFVVDTTGNYTASASGFIVRADTLAALPGAKIVLSGQITTSAANGSFSFTNLPAGLGGTVQVGLITATGFEDKPFFIDPVLGSSPPNNDLGNIPVSPPVGGIPGGPTDINGKISLQGMTDLSGTTVELHKKSNGSLLGTVLTQADGKYGFWVIAGQYTVVASHAGFTNKQQDVTLASPAVPQAVNLTLTP